MNNEVQKNPQILDKKAIYKSFMVLNYIGLSKFKIMDIYVHYVAVLKVHTAQSVLTDLMIHQHFNLVLHNYDALTPNTFDNSSSL